MTVNITKIYNDDAPKVGDGGDTLIDLSPLLGFGRRGREALPWRGRGRGIWLLADIGRMPSSAFKLISIQSTGWKLT